MPGPSTDLPNKSGIYQIFCIPSGRAYIGSAINLRLRRNQHYHLLRENRHHSIALQRAWNKYGGKEAFRFEILEEVEPQRLIERENYWFGVRREREGNHGYNVAPIAGNTLGLRQSQATLAKYKEAALRRAEGGLTENQRAAYEMRRNRPPTEAESAYRERRRTMPLTEKQIEAYAKWKYRPPTPGMLEAREKARTRPLSERQWAYYASRRGKKELPKSGAKRSESLRQMWANRTEEERKALGKKLGDVQRGKHYQGRSEAAQRRNGKIKEANLQAILDAMQELGWKNTIQPNMKQAARDISAHMGKSMRGTYVRLQQLVREGKVNFSSPHPIPPPSLTQATLFEEDAS